MSNENLLKLIKKLGLNKKDFYYFFKTSKNRKVQPSFSMGPPWYPSSKYGTISIHDFPLDKPYK